MTTSLNFKPKVAASPIYVGGASLESIQKKYGLDDVIKIASNESPIGPSPRAIEAIQQAALTLNRYPPLSDDELRVALSEFLGRGLGPDNFFSGNGGCDVLAMLAYSFLSPGDECIICRPTFSIYEITARRAGAEMIYVDLDPEDYSYDVEAILAAVTEKTRLIYICSPNNPTGTIITAPQMEILVDNLPPHVLLMTDEVYHHFATRADFPDSLAYVQEGKNIAILHSFSKAFGLAGLRLGYAIAAPEIARYLSRAHQPFHLNQLALRAGLAALQDQAHVEKIVKLVLSGRDWLYEQLTRLGLRLWPSQANFILFKPPFPAAEVSERLLRRGVIVRPMTPFYLPTHLRVTVGLPAENKRFIDALRDTLVELEAEGVSKEETVEQDKGTFKF